MSDTLTRLAEVLEARKARRRTAPTSPACITRA